MQARQRQSGKPILFIDIDETQENEKRQSYSFRLTSEARQLLSSVGGRKVAVLVIAGPQRTGKSFLANRFLNSMDGFAIGPTTNPCTKGIWAWSTAVKLNDQTDMIILDTEGLNSVQRDQTIDMKIFSISVLLASMFIYNNLGHIDEAAIENLSLVLRLSQNICVQKTSDGDQKLGEFFPAFYWIMRDFSLDLKGMSPKDYLEKCLSAFPGNSPEILKKNEIREKFKQFFTKRDCETFVRPLDDEYKLARIEQQSWESLRPAFRQSVQNFERKVLENIQPKTISGKVLTGDMLAGLCEQYLQQINSGGIPTIMNSLEAVISGQTRREFEEARSMYLSKMNECFSPEKLPMDEAKFQSIHKQIVDEIFSRLKQKSGGFVDQEQSKILQKDLQDIMDSEFNIKATLNTQVSENSCLKLFLGIIKQLTLPTFSQFDQITPNVLISKYEELMKLLQQYNSSSNGQFKFSVFFNKFPQKIFEYFNAFFGRAYKIFQDELSKQKLKIEQASESQDLIRNQIALYEKNNADLTQELQEAKAIADQYRYQLKNANFSENGDKMQFGKAEELNMEIERLKEKLEKYRTENEQLSDSLHKTRIELEGKKVESDILKTTLEELKKSGDSEEGNALTKEVPDALGSIRALKAQIIEMDEYFSTHCAKEASLETSSQEYQSYRQERVQMKLSFQAKLEQYKKMIEVDKEGLKKNIDILNRHINDLRAKNMQFIEEQEEVKRKAAQFQNLIHENEMLKEAFSAKQANLETATEYNAQKQSELNKMEQHLFELQQQLGEIKFENCEMATFKETIYYIMREALKFAQNKNNTLNNSLRKLNPEDIKQLKQCFASAGVNLG